MLRGAPVPRVAWPRPIRRTWSIPSSCQPSPRLVVTGCGRRSGRHDPRQRRQRFARVQLLRAELEIQVSRELRRIGFLPIAKESTNAGVAPEFGAALRTAAEGAAVLLDNHLLVDPRII